MAITENILIEYKAMMDEDMAMIKLMVDQFCSPKYLDEGFLKADVKAVLQRLASRANPNPLYACLKQEFFGNVSKTLYKQLTDGYYDEIYKRTQPSAIAIVVNTLQHAPNNNMACTVLCTNDKQKELILEYDKDLKVVIVPDFDSKGYDVKEYTSIFCKDIINLLRYKNLDQKNIYIARLMYNLDNVMGTLIPKVAIADIVGRTNKINLIDFYSVNVPTGYVAPNINTTKET